MFTYEILYHSLCLQLLNTLRTAAQSSSSISAGLATMCNAVGPALAGCGGNCYRIWGFLLSNMYPCLYFCRILLIFRVSTSLAEYGRIRLGYASGYVVSKISPHSCIGYTHDLTACYPILSEILDMRGYGTDMTRILHGYGRRYMNTPPPELTLNDNGGNHSFYG